MVDYRARAREIALEEGVSPDLFERLVEAESSFNPRARSSAGAQGLGQLMPGTARDLGVDPNDPEQNLRGSARYLRQMKDRFKSTPLALAAYNAGPGRVSRSGGIPRIAETEAYVAKINAQDDDSDIFGRPMGARPAAVPAGPSIRQGEDGVIEIDINEGRGAPDSPFGDDADIFASSSVSEVATAPTVDAPALAEPDQADQLLGFLKGVFKPLDNAANAVERGLKKVGVDTDWIADVFGTPTAREATDSRKAFVERQRSNGIRPGKIGEFAGNVIGTLPTAMLPGGVLAQGAAGGALLTDKEDAAGIVGDMAAGAAGGKIADVALSGLGRALSPQVSKLVQTLQKAGVPLTPGQITGGRLRGIEDRLQSVPIIGPAITDARRRGIDQFNRAAIARTIKPIGIDLPDNIATGHEAVKFAEDALSKAYDDLLPNLKVKPDADLVKGIQALGPEIQTLPAERQAQLSKVLLRSVEKLKGSGQGIEGKAFKEVESDLGKFAKRYSATGDGDQQAMASVAMDVLTELRDMLVRQNPQAAKQLKDINTGYANLVRVQDAAASSAAPEGIFSASGLNSAVRKGAGGVRKRAMSKGEALMQDLSKAGKAVLPSTIPDSGSAARLLSATPQGLAVGGLALPALPIYSKTGGRLIQKLLAGERSATSKVIAKQLPKLKRPAVAIGSAATVKARQ